MITIYFDLFFYFLMILIVICDLKEKIIPDQFTFAIIILAIFKIFILNENFEKSFIGMGIYPIFFTFIYGYSDYFLKKDVIGFGDIKLLSGIGFYFGYLGIYNLIIFYNIIFILAFIYIIPKILLKKIDREQKVPFAPFICFGTFVFELMVIL